MLTKDSKWVLEEKATLRETYKTYCLPKIVGSRLKLACTVYGCGSDVNYHNVKDEVDDFSFSNFKLHLLSCKGCPVLTERDYGKLNVKRSRAEPVLAEVVAQPSSISSIEHHLRQLDMDETEFRTSALKFMLADQRPLSMGDRPGFKFFLKKLMLPSLSERTLVRRFHTVYDELVMRPVRDALEEASKPSLVRCDSVAYELRFYYLGSADGFEAGGETFESMVLGLPEVAQVKTVTRKPGSLEVETRTSLPRLQRRELFLALAHWEVGFAGASAAGLQKGVFTANAHAALLERILERHKLKPSQLRALIMDTTAGNPAVLREPAWQHAQYLECLQHVLTLVLHDLMAVEAFKDAHDAAQALTVWLRGSAKRIDALRRTSRSKLLPLAPSNTRFGQRLLMIARLMDLWPALSAMFCTTQSKLPLFNGEERQDDPGTVKKYEELHKAVLEQRDTLMSLAELEKPFMQAITYLGSSDSYTTGSTYDVFENISAALEKLRSHEHMQPIATACMNSLLERFATYHQASSVLDKWPGMYCTPSFMKPENPEKFTLRIKSDERLFAAMLLDPQNFPKALSRCPDGWEDPLVTFLYTTILIPAATRLTPIDAVPATITRTALQVELARIRDKPKPDGMGDALWKSMQDGMEVEARAAAKDKSGQQYKEGEGGQKEPFFPLLQALRLEVEAHAVVLRQEFLKAAAATGQGKAYEPYGRPLTHGNDARYEYWPSQKATKPLLFFCAATLLAGDCNSTATCERKHSVATRLTESQRRLMKPDTVERLTLGCIYSRQWIKDLTDTPTKCAALEAEQQEELLKAEQAASDEGIEFLDD